MDIAWDPEGEDDFEAFGAGQVGGQPDFFEGFKDLGLGVERSTAWPFGFGFTESFKFFEYPDGVFAVVA